MSGLFTKLNYDDCTYFEKIKQWKQPLNYNLFSGKHENLNGEKSCSHMKYNFYNDEIKFCINCTDNDKSTIKNNYKSKGKRTDIESKLKLLLEPSSKCSIENNPLCWIGFVNNNSVCNENVTLQNPFVCDRKITPTNVFKCNSFNDYKILENKINHFSYF